MQTEKIAQHLSHLSGGAVKVWLALQIWPETETAKIAARTGYSDSQVRRLFGELRAYGLAPDPAHEYMGQDYGPILAIGVREESARAVVQLYTADEIRYAFNELERVGPRNPAGYFLRVLADYHTRIRQESDSGPGYTGGKYADLIKS